MKKELATTLCLVVSVSLLLCSCGINNTPNAGTLTTGGDALTTTQGDTPSTIPTDVEHPVDTESSTPDNERIEPTEDKVTEPTQEPTQDSDDTTKAPTTTTTEAPTTTTKAPTTTQAHKHSYTAKVTKAATCTTEGVKTFTCSGCSDQYTEAIAKKTHEKDNGTVTKAATCTATGTKAYKCSVCKTSMGTESIPKSSHKWGGWTTIKAATVLEQGTTQRSCSKCSASESKAIAKLKGTYENADITSRLQKNKVNILPVKVTYNADGTLTVKACFFNNTDHTEYNYSVLTMFVYDNNDTLIAKANFDTASQRFTIGAGQCVYHTYTFPIDCVFTYTPDMSNIYL